MTHPQHSLVFLDRSPVLFALAKTMKRNRLRGGGRLMSSLEATGYLARKVVALRAGGRRFYVPIDRPEQWDQYDVDHYEGALVDLIAEEASGFDLGTTLIDCGADIGLISVLLASRLDMIGRIYAFEPSEEAFEVLQRNLSSLSVPAEPMQMAVSDFSGRGELLTPEYDSSHFAKYLAPVESGGFRVTSIDDVIAEVADLIVKIDVEGGELAVLKGARRTISAAGKVLVTLEAHPKVFMRTGIDPNVLLSTLLDFRDFKFVVAECRSQGVDLSRPFFDQFTDRDAVYNIVCVSR